MQKQDEHFLQIKQIYPDMSAIYKPITLGIVHDIYIIESNNNKFVCRFSDEATAKHNFTVSNIFRSHKIPVPDIKIHSLNGQWCETYSFIPGKTLHERLLEGLSGKKLDDVYFQLLKTTKKISEIKYDNIPNATMPLTSKILQKMIVLLNPDEHKLCHADLNAKNIVLDENDNIRAILDLDMVLLAPLSFSYIILMKSAVTYGYDIRKINKMLKDKKIKHPYLQIKFLCFMTQMFPKCIRKQLLKIHIK